jgi:hypothetical protein
VGVVHDGQPAVRGVANVQLDAIGAQVGGRPERADGVLRRDQRGAPVADHE